MLDRYVNDEIAGVVARWNDRKPDRRRYSAKSELRVWKRINRALGRGLFYSLSETWASESPLVAHLDQSGGDVYDGTKIYESVPVKVAGIGKTLRLGGHLVGADKIGHFFQEGLLYRKFERRGGRDAAVARIVRTETGFYGYAGTSVFSNADLVADYEGALF